MQPGTLTTLGTQLSALGTELTPLCGGSQGSLKAILCIDNLSIQTKTDMTTKTDAKCNRTGDNDDDETRRGTSL